MSTRTSRRDFLKTTAAVGAGFWVTGLPDLYAKPPGPNERLNIAIIGAGGRGGGNLGAVAQSENIAVICDVDLNRAGGAFNQFPNARRYTDYRVMLEMERSRIDAVVVSTPDHNHAPASIMAMRMGKHCYCEKPLTHSVWESRQMKLVAQQNNVKTQMGNQGTSNSTFRTGVEIIRSGVLGAIREVHVWTNRPIWPQNIAQRPAGQPVPSSLDWDRWVGPAPWREYNQAYVPFAWRGWWDFGTGAIGDMACHTMNLPFMALNLEAPTAVSAVVTTPLNNETAPNGCTVTYEFPARGNQPALNLMWYERGRPPAALFHGRNPSDSGCLVVGANGTLYSPSDYGGSYEMLPMNQFQNYQPPQPSLPRVPGQNHHREWLNSIRGGPAAMSNFVDYAAKLTETALLGNVAMRVGQRFTWNAETLQASVPQAAQYIRRQYRQGWDLI